MSFIHFGCWNYGKCDLESPTNGMSSVIKELMDDSISSDFFIVAGDNYYPLSGDGKKIFNKEDFDSGMLCVKELMAKTEKPVFMLMGNHDLQYEMALYDHDESPESLDKCTLIENQVKYSDDFNFNSNGFMIPDTKTLCLFINSVLYTEKKDEVLECVKKYREEEYRGFESIEEITAHEEEKLKELVESSGEIKNIVVCAHDPIITRRRKVKSRAEIIKKFDKKKGRMPSEKEIIEKLFQDIRKPLLNDGIKFLNSIYNMVPPEAKKYYLCADTHQYQYGLVKLGDNNIHQYVVGTGGTKCDLDEIPIDETKVIVPTNPEIIVTLQIKETIHSFGYLYCSHEAENLKCQFIEVAPCDAFDQDPSAARLDPQVIPDPSEGGPATPKGGKRRKNKTRKKRRTKRGGISRVKEYVIQNNDINISNFSRNHLHGTFGIVQTMRAEIDMEGFWIVRESYLPELGFSDPVYSLAHIDANDLNRELQTMSHYTLFVNGEVRQI
jgi:hypothetical protein